MIYRRWKFIRDKKVCATTTCTHTFILDLHLLRAVTCVLSGRAQERKRRKEQLKFLRKREARTANDPAFDFMYGEDVG
jgi:hypothetical protein